MKRPFLTLFHLSAIVAVVWNIADRSWDRAFGWAVVYLLINIWAALEDICVALEDEDEDKDDVPVERIP